MSRAATTAPTDLRDAVGASPPRAAGPPALRRLDGLLWRAVDAAQTRYASDAPTDPSRRWPPDAKQTAQAFDNHEPRPADSASAQREIAGALPRWDQIIADDPGWAWLQATYRLTDVELDIVLIALGPEVDLRYERLFAFLQDDVTRRRPTVDLVLDLLTTTVAERTAARGLFAPGAGLLRHHVLILSPDPRAVLPPLIAYLVALDPQIVDVLLRQTTMDARLAPYCRLLPCRPAELADVPLGGEAMRALRRLLVTAWQRDPLRLYFRGSAGGGRRRTAEALAAGHGAPLLVVEADRIPLDGETTADLLAVVLREAQLHGALLYLDGIDGLRADQHANRALMERLSGHHGVVILAGMREWRSFGSDPLGVLEVPFDVGGTAARRGSWERALAAHGLSVAPSDLDALAGRFRLGPGQIEDAVLASLASARWRAAADGPETATAPVPNRVELVAAARGQLRHDLAALAQRIEPGYGFADIVLPADAMAQLRELCDRVTHREQVIRGWGFGRRLSQGRGVSALFAGPPGTGKTMAAEVVARELGLELYKIELSRVVSKYIGETEKNLERVFTAATDADAILFFDEADALFGKRSGVRDAHDRYANIEIAYLLQRMEQYDGITILATNLRQHLDDAFLRRLQFVIEFPFPDDAERRRIWQLSFPSEAPRDPAIDVDRLAREVRLAGGNIKNIALAAAFCAAADQAPIGMAHLVRGIRREHQKLGRPLPQVALPDEGTTGVPGP